MTTTSTTTTTTRARVRSSLVATALGVTLAAAPPAGVAGADSAVGSTAAATPPPCSLVQPCRLSTGLPPSPSSHGPILTPDGDTAVFKHTSDDGITSNLYAVPVRGGSDPVQLDLPTADQVSDFEISPDGRRVVYTVGPGAGGENSLFSVPIDGPASASVRLAAPVQFTSPQISPDSRLVTYRAVLGGRVRAVAIDGPEAASVALTQPGATQEKIRSDSRRLVYLAGPPGGRELFSVPLTLNPPPVPRPQRLNGPMIEGGQVDSFRLPVGPGPVVYSADQDTQHIRELYSVGFGGGTLTKLNVPLPAGWDVGLKNDHPHGFESGYGISRDGRRVVYVIQLSCCITVNGLFSVPVTGPTDASRRLDVTAPNTLPALFHITSDSSRVVYAAAEDVGSSDRAFSVPIDGPAGERVRVSTTGEDGAFVQVSPDGQRVVSRTVISNQDVVLSAPVDEPVLGPNLVRLNGPERLTGAVSFDPLSQRVAYVADAVVGEHDVFSSALTSRSRSNLTETLTADFIRLEPLGVSDQHVVYSAHVSDDGFQLYSSAMVPQA